jgi:hypothetical protein
MKKAIMLLSVMCVAVSLLLLPSQVAASTVTLRVSQLQGNLTAALRERAAHLGPADHLVLYFDRAGTFTIEGTVEFACNVEIKGLGVKKTTVVLDNGTWLCRYTTSRSSSRTTTEYGGMAPRSMPSSCATAPR